MEMRAMMRKEPGSRPVVMRCHSAVLRVAAMASVAKGRSRPGATTDWAQIDTMTGEDCVALAIIGDFNSGSRLRRLQSNADGWKLGAAAGVRQESEVPDAAEPFWQDVSRKRRMSSPASSVITLDLLSAPSPFQ